MKFTVAQILDEVSRLQGGDPDLCETDSVVWDAWAQMADSWLSEEPIEYVRNGFKGFYQRSGEEILEDFRLNDRVEESCE